MIKTNYDAKRTAAIIEFKGDVDGMQAEKAVADLSKILPKNGDGFVLLADFSEVGTMELAVKAAIEKSMDLMDARSVKEILRVLPDPAMDLGFRLMSSAHYSTHPKIITCRSREEADAYLQRGLATKMRATQISRPGGPFELVDREIPQPAAGQVLIKVQACGVCHSDVLVQGGFWPGLQYPRVPGHEVIGIVNAIGANVSDWRLGQRVGVGWYGGHCGHCQSCRSGDFIVCQNLQITGVSFDGGYAEYMLAPASALALVPDDLSSVEAAPLMCAGITTFNALRKSHALGGDLVAVLGLGGLGHLGVQYAAKLGFKTVGIARGKDKEPLAQKLGAHHYIDSQAQDVAGELQKLGGAKVILSTVTNGDAMSAAVGGLAANGSMIVVGADQSMQVSPVFLLGGRRSIQGWPSGTALDSEQTLAFSMLTNVRSMNEVFPF